jgi:hypothetical protein
MSKAPVVVGDVLVGMAHEVKAEDVIRLAFDPLEATRVCADGIQELEKHRGAIATLYPSFNLTELEMLPELCKRIIKTQYAVDKLRQRPNVYQDRVLVVLDWRRRLMAVAEALLANGRIDAEVLAAIHGSRGQLAQVQDVPALCTVLAPFEATVNEACGKGALAHAREAVTEALGAAGVASESESEARETADLRDRFATLVGRLHDRLRVALSLVTSYKQARELLPPLNSRSHQKLKDPVGVPVADPPAPV